MASLSVIERRLLGKSASRTVRTAAFLLLLQIPMWAAVGPTGECAVPMRLSLLVDAGFCAALLVACLRLTEYFLASHPTPLCRAVGLSAAAGLGAAALLNVLENAVLWGRFDGTYDAGCPATTVAGLSAVWWATGIVSGLVLAGAIVHARRELARGVGDPMREAVLRSPSVKDRPGTIIACSGGGIRSASFSLGALQALMRNGVYRNADAVVGVSGGGYMAAAFHLAGRNLATDDDPPFAQGTPELALLRRNTRYLLPHGVEVFRGVLSILYGVAVNLVIIGVSLWATAWVLGWYLHEYDVLLAAGDDRLFDPSSTWLAVALAPWSAAVLAFVWMEKVVDRFVQVADEWRNASRTFTRMALAAGTATVTLMIVVPASLAWLDSDHTAAAAAVLQDLVTPNQEDVALNFGVLAGLVGALIGLGRTVVTGLGNVEAAGGVLARVVGMLRVRVAPWLGSLLIVAAAFVALLRLTNRYVTDAGWRSDWATAAVLLGVVVGVRVLTDANRTSLHHFYRERLSTAYLVERVDNRTARSRAYRHPLTVSSYADRNGDASPGPRLVMAAVANAVDDEFVPTGRGCVPFIIDAERTGVIGDRSLPRGGTTPTRRYEAFSDYDRRDLTVPAAMAMSGAALSPLTGRASSRTRPVRVLLTVLNARLGVWLPNPYGQHPVVIDRAFREREAWTSGGVPRTRANRLRLGAWETAARLFSIAGKPGPYRLLREAFGRPSLYDRKLYVTDGGHYDNLGLLEALRRRPRKVIVIDASNDAANSFGALAEAIATARMDLGVEISVDLTPVLAPKDGRAARAWTTGTATYDDDPKVSTEILFLKAQLAPDLTWDVEHYARRNPDFPRRSTGDQFYDEWDFEAYRELGHTLACRMLDDLVVEVPASRPDGSVNGAGPSAPEPRQPVGTAQA